MKKSEFTTGDLVLLLAPLTGEVVVPTPYTIAEVELGEDGDYYYKIAEMPQFLFHEGNLAAYDYADFQQAVRAVLEATEKETAAAQTGGEKELRYVADEGTVQAGDIVYVEGRPGYYRALHKGTNKSAIFVLRMGNPKAVKTEVPLSRVMLVARCGTPLALELDQAQRIGWVMASDGITLGAAAQKVKIDEALDTHLALLRLYTLTKDNAYKQAAARLMDALYKGRAIALEEYAVYLQKEGD